MGLRHETIWVEDSEDGDGGGQEDAEHPGENYSVENMVLWLRPLGQGAPDASVSP